MKNFTTSLLIIPVLILHFCYCSGPKITNADSNTKKGLKDYYKDYFPIGAAVTPRSLHGPDSALIVDHFNSITAENAMKMGPIHPRENEYFWRDADSIVAFAKKHNLKMRGHTLCWHAQTPSWLFKTDKGDTVTKEVLLQRLKDHITTVVNRYKDRIYAWDVVNEAIDDRDAVFYRNTAWYRICGEEFIAKAFEYAHAADPKAILFYNDYNTENPGKRQKIYELVKRLKASGVPIHGVGLQGHWSVNNPPREELVKSIEMFSSLGLQVQVTELDVSVYAGRQGGQLISGQRDTSSAFTPEMEQAQREKYKMAFETFRKYREKLTGITFWNLSDRYTWLDGRGRKNYPLLFDTNRQPKKAFGDVVNFNNEQSRSAGSSKTFTNPILAGFYPDPAICRAGDDYYIVNSSFAYFPGLPILHSKDLVTWKQIGHAMDRPEQLELSGAGVSRGLFAPSISYYKGTFYIVCTLIDRGGNFVITAKNPAGPWSNPTWIKEVNGIDPSLFFDGQTDKAYIIYNSNPPGNITRWNGHRTIRMYEFDYQDLKVKGQEKLLVNGGVDTTKKPVWIEAPHIYKIKDWYYLMCAEGGTGYNHSEVIFRSKSPEGPFVPWEKNPILTQRHLDRTRPNPITTTGHADLVQTQNGTWYAVFLGCRPYEGDMYNIGRETFLAPVTWTEDGWPVITKGDEEVQYRYALPLPNVNSKPQNEFSGNFTFRDDFKEAPLNFRYTFLRTVTEKWHSISPANGRLVLNLRPETISGRANPSFVGFRQQHHRATATTRLSFVPRAEHEKAGMVIFQNERSWYFICKSISDGKPVVQLYQASGDTMNLLSSKNLEGSPEDVILRIEPKDDIYTISFSINGKDWTVMQDVDGKILSTARAGGFVGSVFGLYATSLGKPADNKAAFDWFEYKGNDDVFE